MVRKLLALGAQVSRHDIRLVGKRGNIEILRELTKHGAIVSDLDDRFGSALDNCLSSALLAGHIAMVKVIVEEYNVEVTPQCLANAARGSNADREMVMYLISKCHKIEIVLAKVDIVRRCYDECEIIINYEMVELLLQNGAQPDAPTTKGLTLMEKAIAEGDDTLVELLIRYGSDVNRPSERGTPLAYLEKKLNSPAKKLSKEKIERLVKIQKLLKDHGAKKSHCLLM